MAPLLDVRCPAKINLFLEVKGVRPDGYREIATLMQTVDLYDALAFEAVPGSIGFSCNHPRLPLDSRNLCVRAAELISRRAGARGGARIALAKRIPVAAGLGGGSSDAAGTLRGLNELWGLGMTAEALEALAAELGSDVPFFICGGTALCTGRGEVVSPVRRAPSYPYVLLTPPIAVATPAVYAALPPPREKAAAAGEFLNALGSGNPVMLAAALFNRLEEAPCPHVPEVRRLKALLRKHGALGACMSGSGPSVFGIAESSAAAGEIGRAVGREAGDGCFVHWGMTNVSSTAPAAPFS